MSKRQEIWNKAKEAIRDKSRVRRIVSEAKEKLQSKVNDSNELSDFSAKINALIKMLKAYVNGEYTSFSKRTVLLSVFGLLYFIIPTDAIPDFVPALGFTDDISVLYLIYRHISGDVERFLESQK